MFELQQLTGFFIVDYILAPVLLTVIVFIVFKKKFIKLVNRIENSKK